MTGLVVAGALANKAGQGGEAWVRLSWVRGLQRLGFDVTFLEQIRADVDAEAVAYFDTVVSAFGLSAALVTDSGRTIFGMGTDAVAARLGDAAALLDISGTITAPALRDRARRRVYIDIDPGFTQYWAVQGHLGSELAAYDAHVTIAENMHGPARIPTAGFDWLTVRQPVVLEDWPAIRRSFDRFTTVATWRSGFGRVTEGDHTFGLKLDEFRKAATLPRRSGHSFELALAIHPTEVDDLDLLAGGGWQLVDPAELASTPESFRRYVQESGAEFSVAQGIYVETDSGWFSDRTTRYLASGRPALVQDTGFSRTVPVGEGLVAFTTLDEAVAGAATIVADYPGHVEAARDIAERYFASDVVLGPLCERLGLSP